MIKSQIQRWFLNDFPKKDARSGYLRTQRKIREAAKTCLYTVYIFHISKFVANVNVYIHAEY